MTENWEGESIAPQEVGGEEDGRGKAWDDIADLSHQFASTGVGVRKTIGRRFGGQGSPGDMTSPWTAPPIRHRTPSLITLETIREPTDAETEARAIADGSSAAIERLMEAIARREQSRYAPILFSLRIIWSRGMASEHAGKAAFLALQRLGSAKPGERDALAVGGLLTAVALHSPMRLSAAVRLVSPQTATASEVLETILTLRSAINDRKVYGGS